MARKLGPDAVVKAILLAKGYVEDGETAVQEFRFGTVANPIFGGIGGVMGKQGGRKRFAFPTTDERVTVGKVTTNFYAVNGGRVSDFIQFKTRDVESITSFIAKKRGRR